MSQPSNPTSAPATVAALPNRRGKRRACISQPVRVRPSEPIPNTFDEVRATINVCRNGLYFDTDRGCYKVGMRLFITFPFHEDVQAINLEYIGRVVRIDKRADGRFAVAVELLMTCNLQGGQEGSSRNVRVGS